jgi:hypothetical protein
MVLSDDACADNDDSEADEDRRCADALVSFLTGADTQLHASAHLDHCRRTLRLT